MLNGKRVRELRTQQGITTKALAELLGCTPAQIGNVENGFSSLTTKRLVKLVEVLGTSADYLLDLDQDDRVYKSACERAQKNMYRDAYKAARNNIMKELSSCLTN